MTVGVVRGADGLLVVDTRSSHREAGALRADLAPLGGPVRWVVNTHAHYDHSFGNAVFGPGSDVGARIWGHRRVPAHHAAYEVPMLAGWVAEGREPVEEWREVEITGPTELVDDRATLDLGDRAVELRHLGRGHTDNDLLVQVPDAAVWLVGDLVEESGPPMYGSGSFPLDWADTVGRIVATVSEDDLLVPGHGAVVDRSFALRQQADLAAVADLVRELHAAGVSEGEAVAAGGDRWPFPPEGLATAVAAGYQQLGGSLPGGARR